MVAAAAVVVEEAGEVAVSGLGVRAERVALGQRVDLEALDFS